MFILTRVSLVDVAVFPHLQSKSLHPRMMVQIYFSLEIKCINVTKPLGWCTQSNSENVLKRLLCFAEL